MDSRLGRQVPYFGPAILFFVSTFCSKCMANRRVLSRYIDKKDIAEINIADDQLILKEIKPKLVPAICILNQKNEVIFYKEGLISKEEVNQLSKIWVQLKDNPSS